MENEVDLLTILPLMDTFNDPYVMSTGVSLLDKFLQNNTNFHNFPISHVVESLSKFLLIYKLDDVQNTLLFLHVIKLLLKKIEYTTNYIIQFDIHIILSIAFRRDIDPLVVGQITNIFSILCEFNPLIVANTIGIDPFIKTIQKRTNKDEFDDLSKNCIVSIKNIVSKVVYR